MLRLCVKFEKNSKYRLKYRLIIGKITNVPFIDMCIHTGTTRVSEIYVQVTWGSY